MEIFKESKMSLCNKCNNINETCNMNVSMSCGTDSKIGKAFVEKCNTFNKSMGQTHAKSKVLSVANMQDTRVEMMGGGHADPEKPEGINASQ